MKVDEIKDKLSRAFKILLDVSNKRAFQLLPPNLTSGKAYEAHVLSKVCYALKSEEGCALKLKNDSKLVLKTKGGPINRAYPWIEVSKDGKVLGDLFTDVEFLSYSYSARFTTQSPTLGEYHELDIIMSSPGAEGRPRHDQVLLGVECKHTEYQKSLLKEILGVRREMGLLADPIKTQFKNWPASTVPSDPPSCLLVYSSSEKVNNYSKPGETFGIEFIYEPM